MLEGAGWATGCGGGGDGDGGGAVCGAGCGSGSDLINWRSGTKICNGGGPTRGGKSNWGRANAAVTKKKRTTCKRKKEIKLQTFKNKKIKT